MRRGGKTTFLHQLRHEASQSGTPIHRQPYLNFEDERLVGIQAKDLDVLREAQDRRLAEFDEAEEATHWFLDEIQVVPGWESFVRRLLDSGDAQVTISGSSADLLSREIATALRGRAWTVPIYPFSFEEALTHAGHALPKTPSLLTSKERTRIELAFQSWLTRGGFPEAQSLATADRFQLLRDYVDVAILRDVVERHTVRNVAGLRWLVRHLLGNAGSLFSIEKFHGTLKSQGIAISRDTLHELLAHLEDCFLVRLLWMESSSERQRMVNPRKAYPIDPGLIPIFDRSGKSNEGHALETAVLLELERRRATLTYVKTPNGLKVDMAAGSMPRESWERLA